MAISYDRLCEIWDGDLKLRSSDRQSWIRRMRSAGAGDFSGVTDEEREAFEIGQGIKEPPRRPGDEITDQDLRVLFFIELPDTGTVPTSSRSYAKWMMEGKRWLAHRLAEYAMHLQETGDADTWTVKRITSNPYASDIYHAVDYYRFSKIKSMPPEEVERQLVLMNPGKIIPRFDCNRKLPQAKAEPDAETWEYVAREMDFEREGEVVLKVSDVRVKSRVSSDDELETQQSVNASVVAKGETTNEEMPTSDYEVDNTQHVSESTSSSSRENAEDLTWLQ